MTTLKRTKPITVSPASQWAHERTQLLEQIQRLKDSLTTEAANVVQLTAALSTEKDARAQSDEDAETLRGELAQMSAALETAENDALVLAQLIATKRAEAVKIMEREDLAIDNLDDPYQKLAFTFYTDLCTLESAANPFLERDANLRQVIAESVATASEEQIDAGMEKLRAAVAEAWIGEGDAPNELTGRTE